MPRTLGVAPPSRGLADDLTGLLIDGLESLRQRVVQRIRFRRGEWFLNILMGLDYRLLEGFTTTLELATTAITQEVRSEGGPEIIEIHDVVSTLDHETRRFSYSARIETIYGMMELEVSPVDLTDLTPAVDTGTVTPTPIGPPPGVLTDFDPDDFSPVDYG